jgi:hypothetical protein
MEELLYPCPKCIDIDSYSFTFKQEVKSNIWNIDVPYDNRMIISVYDENFNVILPLDVIINNNNSIVIRFSQEYKGNSIITNSYCTLCRGSREVNWIENVFGDNR